MIVTCESCKTKFRLDPARFQKPVKKVRCTQCGYVFPLDLPPPVEEPEEDLINFDLPDDEEEQEEARDESPADDDMGMDEDIGMDGLLSPAPSAAPVAEESTFTPKQKQNTGMKIALGAVLLAVLLGGGLFLWLSMSTSTTSVNTPTTGATASSEVVQPLVTIIDTTQAYFLDNAHTGQLFVVEGEIVNETSKPVSFIMLEGKLYGKNYQVAQSQRCFAGNSISRNDLAKLGITEIQNRMMNREGKDLINVHIPTTKRVPFMLVFHNLPEMDSLTDYSVEIMSAKVD